MSIFCNVLEADGDTALQLCNNGGAGVQVDGWSKGLGCKHYHSSRLGFGGEKMSSFVGKSG